MVPRLLPLQTLHNVDRRHTPWLIVAGHRPIYVASTNTNWPDGDQPVSQMLRDVFEDLFVEHAVRAGQGRMGVAVGAV